MTTREQLPKEDLFVTVQSKDKRLGYKHFSKMGEAAAANPLGLPVGEDGTVPQFRLTRLEGTEPARRTALCTMVLDHLSANQAEGIFFFNALHRQHQVAAILALEPGGTHAMVDAFVRAPENLQDAALFSVGRHEEC